MKVFLQLNSGDISFIAAQPTTATRTSSSGVSVVTFSLFFFVYYFYWALVFINFYVLHCFSLQDSAAPPTSVKEQFQTYLHSFPFDLFYVFWNFFYWCFDFWYFFDFWFIDLLINLWNFVFVVLSSAPLLFWKREYAQAKILKNCARKSSRNKSLLSSWRSFFQSLWSSTSISAV